MCYVSILSVYESSVKYCAIVFNDVFEDAVTKLTWVLQAEVRLRLCVSLVDDVLTHVLGQDLVEDVVDGEREAGLVLQQLLHQQRVQVVGVHHVVPAHRSFYYSPKAISIFPKWLFPPNFGIRILHSGAR